MIDCKMQKNCINQIGENNAILGEIWLKKFNLVNVNKNPWKIRTHDLGHKPDTFTTELYHNDL